MKTMSSDRAIELIYEAQRQLNRAYETLHDVAYGQNNFTPEETDQIRTALFHGPTETVALINAMIAKINIL